MRTSGRRVRARLVARLILATRGVDAAVKLFDRARSRIVVRFASPEVLAEFNALAYQRDKAYVPRSQQFRRNLFAWENATLRRHFPEPPARLLVGGAGGGREAFALAERGYDVVAFEPAADLAAGMADNPSAIRVRAFRAAYETLPHLAPARRGDAEEDLRSLGPFDGALMGWCSFSHLTSEEDRIGALRSMAEVVDGPILVSFLAFRHDTAAGSGSRHHGDAFSAFIGYYHVSTPAELERLGRAAGLEVDALESEETEASWPHAVLRRCTDRSTSPSA